MTHVPLQAVGAVPKQQSACEFACYIVSACMVREPVLAASDLLNTLDALSQLARTLPQAAAQQLQNLVEQARRPRWAPFTHFWRLSVYNLHICP